MNTRETWLVTGASGFFGANFPHVSDSSQLIALTRDGTTPPGYHSAVKADLNDPTSIRAAINESQPTHVLHAAALASHEECERQPELAFGINTDATSVMAQAAKECGSTMIYLSTDAVFSGETGNYSETDQPNPFSVYGKSKYEGEQRVLEINPESLIVRTNFFGWSPTHSRSILEFFLNNLQAGNQINGYTDFTVSSIYVRYLAHHIRQLKGEPGVWHVASRDALTKFEFGLQVAEVFDLDPQLISPVSGKGEVCRVRNISLDTAKFRNFLSEFGAHELSSQFEGILQARKDRGLSLANV